MCNIDISQMSSKSFFEIIAIKRFVFQILLVFLRMIALADGDLDVLIVFRSSQGGRFGAFRAALPAASRAAAQEHVAEFRALAAADEAEADTKEENPGADSAEAGEVDATHVVAQQADLVFISLQVF